MCGISVVISKKSKSFDLRDDLKRMNVLIDHRGPDFNNIFIYKNVGLGHTRLSILDLSEKGNQPFSYLDKYIIVFNGEIYNFIDLREDLKKKGYKFTSHTDTEVILASYDLWGEDCVKKFNGMWAFSILDKEKNKIFLSRDRFGIKPLYYINTKNFFAFGSEIKQLLEFSSKRINLDRVYDYLILSKDEYLDQTFFKDINKLPAGHNFILDLKSNNYIIECYYKLSKKEEFKNITFEQAKVHFEKLFESSIKYRLISDVEVGSCLSGGLDSSTIVATALKLSINKEKFKTFHAKSKNHQPTDESLYVDLLSEKLNFDSKKSIVENHDILSFCKKGIKIQEEPFLSPSVLLQAFVMKNAKKENYKVLLDGQGGDETLLGYERYFPIFLKNINLFQRFKYFKQLSSNSKLSLNKLFQYYVYFNFPTIRKLVFLKKTSFILKTKTFKAWKNKLIFKKYKSISDLQISEICENQLPHLLRYEDKNSRAFSVETRLPFLDYRLVEFLISINPEFKLFKGWSKYLLRNFANNKMPEELTWRKNKMGFEFDQDSLINLIEEEFKLNVDKSDILSKIIDKPKLIKEYKSLSNDLKWRLYNLMIWEKEFNLKL